MAIFRGTGGSGNSTDDSIVSAVTEQAGIATTKAGEAATSASNANTSATNAATSATTASTKATEANTAKNSAEDARDSAQAYRDTALQAASTAGSHANAAETSAQTANNSSVQTVAGISTEVQNVNNIRTEIQNVDTIKTDVTTVSGISSNVTTVAADASDIGTVATNIVNVNNVGDNIANVNAVHSNASNINTVAADASDIGTVSSNISNVNTVAGISSDVTTVAGLESKMDTVIADASDIGAVANNIGDVTTVAGINSDVDTVAGIAAKVTTVADNITDVQNADTNAANASASASQAANSASAAGTSASTASTKATEASNSATAASNSATTATTKATEAAGSATTATNKATEASTSATNAATSATTATTKASEAASSATAASGSATTATTKASEASVSAASAATSATDASNAENAWSSFYTTYLGSYSAPPTVDVQGNALQTGAFYYDTGTGSNTVGLYVYNGSSWVYSTNYNNVTAPYSLSQDLATNSYDINFGNNAKANFGASDDLQIYHNGTNSIIDNTGSGSLIIQDTDGTGDILIRPKSGQTAIAAYNDNTVELGYAGSVKLATTSTGINVTGGSTGNVASFTGAHPSRNLLITNYTSGGDGSSYAINANSGYGQIKLQTVSNDRIKIANNGDISFYEDTGTTPKLLWDASAEQLIAKDNAFFKVTETDSSTVAAQLKSDSDEGLLQLYHNGAEKVRLRTNADSYFNGGNVGIGTSSPDSALEVQGSVNSVHEVHIQNTFDDNDGTGDNPSSKLRLSAASNNGYIECHGAPEDAAGNHKIDIGSTAASSFLTFSPNNGEKMRIDASGNLGIGTNTPLDKFHVANGSTGAGYLRIANNEGYARLGTDGGNLLLDVGGSEKARIDSSGNLLVGTTSTVPQEGTHGFVARANGYTIASVDDARVMLVNRGTSDGELINFRKDNTTVGSIGTDSNSQLMIGSGDTGLSFQSNNDAIIPRNTSGAARTGLINLGTSGAQFKDIHLSGKVYVPDVRSSGSQYFTHTSDVRFRNTSGSERMRIDSSGHVIIPAGITLGTTVGTYAASNTLDDYEEGTWTPTLIGSTGGSATMTVARNNYTKVGNMCTAYMYVNAVDTTGSFSGDVRIGGLPFAAGNNFEQAVTVTYCNLFNFDEADRTVSGYVSGTQIWLHNGSSNATVSTSNLNSASNGVTMLAVTYRTA